MLFMEVCENNMGNVGYPPPELFPDCQAKRYPLRHNVRKGGVGVSFPFLLCRRNHCHICTHDERNNVRCEHPFRI